MKKIANLRKQNKKNTYKQQAEIDLLMQRFDLDRRIVVLGRVRFLNRVIEVPYLRYDPLIGVIENIVLTLHGMNFVHYDAGQAI